MQGGVIKNFVKDDECAKKVMGALILVPYLTANSALHTKSKNLSHFQKQLLKI